jgi:hypothetical protein
METQTEEPQLKPFQVDRLSYAKEPININQVKKISAMTGQVISIVRGAKGLFGKYWLTPDDILKQFNYSNVTIQKEYGLGELTMEELLIIIDNTLSLYCFKRKGEPVTSEITEILYYGNEKEAGE